MNSGTNDIPVANTQLHTFRNNAQASHLNAQIYPRISPIFSHLSFFGSSNHGLAIKNHRSAYLNQYAPNIIISDLCFTNPSNLASTDVTDPT